MKELLQQAVAIDPTMRSQFLTEHNIQLTDLLKIMGDPDSELRDELAYRIFAEMVTYEKISNETLRNLALQLISDDYLFYQIGEKDTTSVYKRSFSALWLTILLNIDAQPQRSFLTIEETHTIFDKAAIYLQKERDTRGFVENEGWANAVSHGTDLYIACLLHPAFEMQTVSVMLQGFPKVIWAGRVFVDDEENKMAQFLSGLQGIDFPEDVLVEWVEQLFDKLQYYLMQEGYTPAYFKARTNSIHLMQALYFKLKFSKTYPKLQGVASIFIAKWS